MIKVKVIEASEEISGRIVKEGKTLIELNINNLEDVVLNKEKEEELKKLVASIAHDLCAKGGDVYSVEVEKD